MSLSPIPRSVEDEEESVMGCLGLIFLLEAAEGGEGQASAIKARNQVSEYPPLSKLAGCFLCTTVLAAKIPGIVEHLDLQDIASFLNVTPKTISMIRKDITFGKD